MTELVPKVAALDGFVDEVKKNQGIGLEEAGAGRILIVETANSTYIIQILDPAERTVRVTGGKYFLTPEECTLSGSTFGGANIRLGWIGLGMCMEFHRPYTKFDEQRITTSPIKTISFPGTPSKHVH